MSCGCQNQCLSLVEGADGITVVGDGSVVTPYVISAPAETVFDASNNDGTILITPGGPDGHEPEFDLVIDPASTAPVSKSGAGLKIDCCDVATNDVQAFVASGTIDADGGRFVTFIGAASQTLTLPPATEGVSFEIMNIDLVDDVTIARDGADTINPAGLTSIVIPAGGRASFICITLGVWNCSLSASVTTSSGGAAMFSTTLTTFLSLALGPGKWNLHGKGWWDVSTAVAVTYTSRIYNLTAAVEIDRHQTFNASIVMQAAITMQQEISLLVPSVIAFQAAPSGVGGTQLLRDTVLTAVAIDG